MEELFGILSNELRLEVLRFLIRVPGARHGEIRDGLHLARSKSGNVTKALEPLESGGIVIRTDGRYAVDNALELGRLLESAALLNASARRVLLKRAEAEIPAAEQLVEEIRKDVGAAKG
jgi:hypothetical protein